MLLKCGRCGQAVECRPFLEELKAHADAVHFDDFMPLYHDAEGRHVIDHQRLPGGGRGDPIFGACNGICRGEARP